MDQCTTTPLKCHTRTTSWLLSGCSAGPFEHRVRDFISLVLIFSARREASGSRKWSTNIYFLKILFKAPSKVSEVWQLPCKELFWNSPSLKPKTCSYFSNFSTFTVWLIWFYFVLLLIWEQRGQVLGSSVLQEWVNRGGRGGWAVESAGCFSGSPGLIPGTHLGVYNCL